MREIKFRGLRKDGEVWIYGQLCLSDTKTYIVYDEDYTVSVNCCGETLIADRFFEVDSKTVGQFTGLHDKHNEEIYEGDIVKISIEQYGRDGSSKDFRIITGEVKWSHLGFDIRIGTHDGKPVYSDIIQEMHLTDNIISDEWEVSSNIYENPELMEVQNV